MAENRDIPANLARRIKVEAGHRCAIHTCRHIEAQIHHIIPYRQCQKHEYENLIALCPNCHSRADRNEIDRKSLRIYKANLRLAHDRFSQFEMDVIDTLVNNFHPIPFPYYLVILVKRLYDAGYVSITSASLASTSHDWLDITDKGLEFFNSLGDHLQD